MSKVSAGLLMFRKTDEGLEYFLVHPGGPFFRNKDKGTWTIPKGEPLPGEAFAETARREFYEETGITPPSSLINLGNIKQKGGKIVHAWAFITSISGQPDIQSNLFSLEWPKGSGKLIEFPEIDKGLFMKIEEAKIKINPAQIPFLERLEEIKEL